MKNLLILLCTLITGNLLSQDYAMFETHSLTAKAGHIMALEEEIAEHNAKHHANGPYQNIVTTVLNGPRTGQYIFSMGPCTFTQLDDRPSGPDHARDWASVAIHAKKIGGVEFWRRNDNLTHTPVNSPSGFRNMMRVRYFEVSDNGAFIRAQSKIVEMLKAEGSTRPRTMFQRVFPHKDGRDWLYVEPYDSWSELDESSGSTFRERFEKVHGADSWEGFIQDISSSVISRRDEWRAVRSDLMGPGE